MNRLHPKVVWLFFISYLVRLGIVPVAFLFYWLYIIPESVNTSKEIHSAFLFSFLINIAAWVAFSYVLAWLAHHFYRYTLTDAHFQKEYGIFHKRSITIPYGSIQHVDTDAPLLGRILGLADINIHTKGETHRKSEGRLPGLSKEIADNLRDELIKHVEEADRRKE